MDIVGKRDTVFLIYEHYNFVQMALGSIETRVEMCQGCGMGGINKVDSEERKNTFATEYPFIYIFVYEV